MRRLVATSALLIVASGAAGVSQTTDATKQLIIDFFGFRGGREERAAKFQTEDYIQHNPRFLRMDEFTGARGRQAWVRAGEEATRRGGISLVALNGIGLRNPIILMAEGDLMVAVYKGNIAVPGEPGKTYEAFAFEAFRVRNGQFSEHWDQVRLARGWMNPPPARGTGQPAAGRAGGAGQPAAAAAVASAPTPEPRSGCSLPAARIDANKQLVKSFFDGTPTPQNVKTRAALLAEDYIQHNPRFVEFNEKNDAKGRQGFIRAIESGILAPPAAAAAGAPAPSPRTADLVLAECDYVSIVWKQVLPDPDTPARTWEAFTFDTFRMRDGQLAEHWDDATR